MKGPTTSDAIVKERTKGQRNRVYYFPTLLDCVECGQLAGIKMKMSNAYSNLREWRKDMALLEEGDAVMDPLLAYACYLIEEGYKLRGVSVFNPPPRRPCKCKTDEWEHVDLSKHYKQYEERTNLPTICCCPQCFKYTGWKDMTSHEAAASNLFHQGKISLSSYDNPPKDLGVCKCSKELIEVREQMKALPKILEDSDWSMNKGSSIPNRGIRDYNRTVTFERELKVDELELFRNYLRLDKCPGWTGVGVSRVKPGTYSFRTTWDSSD